MVQVEKSMLLMVNDKGRGRRRRVRYAQELAREARKNDFFVDLRTTDSVAKAEEILSGDLSRFGVVAKVGGDGTGEVILNALQKKPDESHIPKFVDFGGGSTDILREAIGIPRFDAGEAMQRVLNGFVYQPDVIGVTVNGHKSFVISIASFGSTADIFDGRRFLGIGGVPGYAWRIPGVIRRADNLEATISIDNREPYDLKDTFDLIINGGGDISKYPLNPGKTYDSGTISVLSLTGTSNNVRLNAVKTLASASAKKHLPEGQIAEAKDVVSITFHKPVKFEREGGYVGELPANETVVFQRVPSKVEIIAPDQQTLQRRGFQREGKEISWIESTLSTAR